MEALNGVRSVARRMGSVPKLVDAMQQHRRNQARDAKQAKKAAA